MATTAPVRIPEEVLAHVQQIAALRGSKPGDLLSQAWDEFLANHRDEIAASFDEVAAMLRSGDTKGLMERSKESRQIRAAAAAKVASAV